MYSLIGDRLLKRFFENLLNRRQVNAANKTMALPANKPDKPDESGYIAGGNPSDTDAALENEQTRENIQLVSSENGSNQPTTDD